MPTDRNKEIVAGVEHFECRKCARVFEVHGCPGNLKPLVPDGFTLEDHEVILYGLCAECGG